MEGLANAEPLEMHGRAGSEGAPHARNTAENKERNRENKLARKDDQQGKGNRGMPKSLAQDDSWAHRRNESHMKRKNPPPRETNIRRRVTP